MNKNILAVMFASFAFSTVAIANGDGSGSAGSTGILPPAPTDGQCYAQQWTPPVMDEGTTTVVVKEAYTSYVVTAAVFEKVDQNVVLRDAYVEHVEKPAVFLTETVDIVTGGGAYWGVNECTDMEPKVGGDAYCYTVTGEEGATTPVEVIRTVEDAIIEDINHAEQSQIVEYFKLVNPSTVLKVNHPEETIELPTSSVTSPGGLEWVQVSCGDVGIPEETSVPLTISLVKALQQALNEAGFDARWVDGIVGPSTRGAILNFKRFHNLPNTPIVTQAVVDALGL